MPAGYIELPFLDGGSDPRRGLFWSSDGTEGGLLQPVPYRGGPMEYVALNGVIADGGQAQQLLAPGADAVTVFLTNPSNAAESLFYNDTGDDATGNPEVDEELPPGAGMIWSNGGPFPVPTEGISIYAATTGHAFRARKV